MPTPDQPPAEEVPTLDEQPTPAEVESANASSSALALPEEALAVEDLEEVDASQLEESDVPTRLEPRHNKKGKLRGIAWRERNKERKSVWYVGIKSEGQRKKQWEELKGQFESANTGLEGRNDPPASVGSSLDGTGSVGNEQASPVIQRPED